MRVQGSVNHLAPIAAITGAIFSLVVNAQTTTLFDPVFAQPAEMTTADFVVFPRAYQGQQMSASEVAAKWCDDLATPTEDGSTQYQVGACELIDNETRVRRCVSITTYWSNGTVRESIQSCPSAQVTIEQREHYQCPPVGYSSYDLAKSLNDTLWCFSLDDILFRDDCPDSMQDGAFVLPVYSSTPEPMVCDVKPDGSACAYLLSDTRDYYQADFELGHVCYVDNTTAQYEAQPVVDGSQDGCLNIGAETLACIEDPNNVCQTNGECQSGCGYVNDIFVCLSDDLDGDNIGDYADPDIDGDGIANELDIDNDGDGIDDPVYDPPSSALPAIHIDLSQTNGLLAEISNKASSLVTGQNEINQSLTDLNGAIDSIVQIPFSELPAGRDCNYLCDVFGEQDIAAIQSQAEELRQQISQRTAQIRTDIASVIDISVTGTLTDITGTIKGQQYGLKWADYDDFWRMLGNIIFVLTVILVLVILMSGNRH